MAAKRIVAIVARRDIMAVLCGSLLVDYSVVCIVCLLCNECVWVNERDVISIKDGKSMGSGCPRKE